MRRQGAPVRQKAAQTMQRPFRKALFARPASRAAQNEKPRLCGPKGAQARQGMTV